MAQMIPDPSGPENIPATQVEALLFDLGGVIIDVDSGRTLRFWAEAAGVDPELLSGKIGSGEHFEQHERGELSCRDYFRALRGEHLQSLTDHQMRDGWNQTLGREIPGVRALVQQLAGRIPLYLFSNTNPTHQREWARDCAEILGYFQDVFVSSELGQRKPEQRAFLSVAGRIGLPPEKILFFDDNPANVGGARAAGMHAVTIREHADLLRAARPWTD